MRRVLAPLVFVAAFSMVGLVHAWPAHAGTEHLVVTDSADAWYANVPADACTAPVGCTPALPVTPYPVGTLHLGVLGGDVSATAYLKLNLAELPAEAASSAGFLTLPLSQDPDAGQLQPATAAFRACLAGTAIRDGVEGGTSGAPHVDCQTAQSPARLAADATSFVVDLRPMLEAWAGGVAENGIALVPSPDQSASAMWQLSFNGRRAAATPRIFAAIDYLIGSGPAGSEQPSLPPSSAAGPPTGGTVASPPLNGGGVAPPLTPSLAETPIAAPTPPLRARRVSVARVSWFAYRGVVYAPLLAALLVTLLCRAVLLPVSPLGPPKTGRRG